jgi:phage replication initiation protein
MHQGLECIFDWMEFTIHDLDEEEIILKVLEMNLADFMELPKGRYGYKKQMANGHISVLYCGTEEMGVHVILSGKGCREYEAGSTLLELLDRIMLQDGKCTRIDMAMDDKTGSLIPFEKIKEAIKTGTISSRWKSSTEYVRRKLQDGEITGHTINIGSRKSKMYMRIYDKALEQGQTTPWIRIELEIRDERAQSLQDILLFEDQIGQVFAKIINNYIRFLEPNRDKNRSRWPTAAWWDNLIGEIGKISLTRKPEDRTVEDVRSWVKQQVGPSLAVLVIADDGALDDIIRTIMEGKTRLKDKHMRILGNKGRERDPWLERFEPV